MIHFHFIRILCCV